tara:strand:+ start:51 stop:524 length:474 start_codon:yes stop_codon:yes gene_type:complete
MKKLFYLLFAVTIIGCSDSDSDYKEYILGEDNLSLVLNNKVFKYVIQVNAPYEYAFITRIVEFKESGTINKYTYHGADGLPYSSGREACWEMYEDDFGGIKIESPNYIEYIDKNNITLIDGKLYYKSTLTSYTGYEMFESSLNEIEKLKEEVKVECE